MAGDWPYEEKYAEHVAAIGFHIQQELARGESTYHSVNAASAALNRDNPWLPGGIYAQVVERGRLEDEARWDRDQQVWEARDPYHFAGSEDLAHDGAEVDGAGS
jgi:S-formylglutathione hydrolase FrmB